MGHSRHLRTPLLVDALQSPEAYLRGLNKPARKNYRLMRRETPLVSYREVPYDPTLLREWFLLWAAQGFRWNIWPEYFDGLAARGWLRLFTVQNKIGSVYALHPVEHFGSFMYTQPVLYNRLGFPEMARFMWFELMLWACREPGVQWVDLGGGFHGSWQDFLHDRSDPAFRYKWQYVSAEVKRDPDGQQPWYAQRCTCGYKCLVEAPVQCAGCGGDGTSG